MNKLSGGPRFYSYILACQMIFLATKNQPRAMGDPRLTNPIRRARQTRAFSVAKRVLFQATPVATSDFRVKALKRRAVYYLGQNRRCPSERITSTPVKRSFRPSNR